MLSVLFVAVAGFSLAPACASELGATTEKLYFQASKYYSSVTEIYKAIDSKNYIAGYADSDEYNNVFIFINHKDDCLPNYKMTECVVEFRKKVNGQTETSTKTFKPGTEGWIGHPIDPFVDYYPKNGFKAYSAVVSYQKR